MVVGSGICFVGAGCGATRHRAHTNCAVSLEPFELDCIKRPEAPAEVDENEPAIDSDVPHIDAADDSRYETNHHNDVSDRHLGFPRNGLLGFLRPIRNGLRSRQRRGAQSTKNFTCGFPIIEADLEGGIRTHFSSRIRIGVPRFLGVPFTAVATSPVSQYLL